MAHDIGILVELLMVLLYFPELMFAPADGGSRASTALGGGRLGTWLYSILLLWVLVRVLVQVLVPTEAG